jgi:hypothetical protein
MRAKTQAATGANTRASRKARPNSRVFNSHETTIRLKIKAITATSIVVVLALDFSDIMRSFHIRLRINFLFI